MKTFTHRYKDWRDHSWKEPLGSGEKRRQGERSPDQVREASVQMHGEGGAAEHRQDALQVQKLQLLTVAAEEENQHTNTDEKGDYRGDVWETLGKILGIT